VTSPGGAGDENRTRVLSLGSGVREEWLALKALVNPSFYGRMAPIFGVRALYGHPECGQVCMVGTTIWSY